MIVFPGVRLVGLKAGDSVVEGRDGADVRPQSSVPHPLNDLTQLGTVGLDKEVDRQAVDWPRLGRPDDGHERSSASNQACRPLPDVAADEIEHQIDSADSAIAFPTVLAARGPAWTVWVPCAVVAGVATRGAYGAGSSHRWIVAVTLVTQAVFIWWQCGQAARSNVAGGLP